jgi:hypothetical protein
MSKSADASPRVAEKMAKTKAHLMMLHANQTTHALKTDKAWSNSLAEREVRGRCGHAPRCAWPDVEVRRFPLCRC